jgi:hypothetical protein
MKQKADKSEIFRLEADKAEKFYVEGEFKKTARELEQNRDWLQRLEDSMKKIGNASPSTVGADLQTRVEKLESQVAWILKQLEELRS